MTAVAQLDAEQLQQFLAQAEQMMATVLEENLDLAKAMLAAIEARIEAIGAGR